MTPELLTDEPRAEGASPGESTLDEARSNQPGSDRVRPDRARWGRPPSNEILLERFQAVAEETRMGIVRLLADGERCVCDLQEAMDAAQSRLSFHLKKLKEAGVVSDRREGRWVYYSLVPTALQEMRAFLGEVVPGEKVPGKTGEKGRGWSSTGSGDGPCCG